MVLNYVCLKTAAVLLGMDSCNFSEISRGKFVFLLEEHLQVYFKMFEEGMCSPVSFPKFARVFH